MKSRELSTLLLPHADYAAVLAHDKNTTITGTHSVKDRFRSSQFNSQTRIIIHEHEKPAPNPGSREDISRRFSGQRQNGQSEQSKSH